MAQWYCGGRIKTPSAFAIGIFVSIVSASSVGAQSTDSEVCGLQRTSFSLVEDQHGRHGGRSSLAVMSSGNAASARGVVTRSFALAVNTDGSPISYATSDPSGQAYGLNSVCNGGVRVHNADIEGTAEQPAGFCESLLTKQQYYEGFEEFRLRSWRNHDNETIAWDKFITPLVEAKKAGDSYLRPCPELTVEFKQKDGSTIGRKFLVNATALKLPGYTSGTACNQSHYVDSRYLPGLVIPKTGYFGADLGDLVIVHNPQRGGQLTYGIVGDTGPAGKFAEGSIGLNKRILGLPKSWTARNYEQLKKDVDASSRKLPQGLDILIIPGSRRLTMAFPESPRSQKLRKAFTESEIEALAIQAFSDWGGQRRLNACRRELDRPQGFFEQLFMAFAPSAASN